jgi:hypothetical protein
MERGTGRLRPVHLYEADFKSLADLRPSHRAIGQPAEDQGDRRSLLDQSRRN